MDGVSRWLLITRACVFSMTITSALIGGLLAAATAPETHWGYFTLAVVGLAMLSGVSAGSSAGDVLVLAGAALYALQIALMERYAPRYDPLAFTTAEMAAAFVGFAVVAVAAGQVEVPRGVTVWAALLVTGIFASAIAFLVQAWAQQTTSATQTALVFSLEPVWAGIFGFALAGDRLGVIGWAGCAVILAGIAVSEPAAARTLARLVRVRRPA